jgi:YVTN family beta-propeller protein
MDRRNFIALPLLAASCQRRKGTGFRGFAFVANAEGNAVAAVDLQAFVVVKHLMLGASPNLMAAHGYKPLAFALTPRNGQLHRISVADLSVDAVRSFTRSATTMRVTQQGDAVWLLSAAERKLLRVNLETLTLESMIGIPEDATGLELSPETPHALLNLGNEGRLAVVNLETRRVAYETRVGTRRAPAQFLKSGALILAADSLERLMVVIDRESGRRIAELPLAITPERFCFKQDGGQLFVTGAGADAVAVVYPFQTQVAGTILAGHAPGNMAASRAPDLLFVANPESGTVTVVDIRTQKAKAVVPVGKRPEAIAITPDNNFALVLNRDSGDMAVIRVDAMAGRRTKAAPLFTMIPVGSGPVSAVVVQV